MKLVINIPHHLASSFIENKGSMSLAAWAIEAMKNYSTNIPAKEFPTEGNTQHDHNCNKRIQPDPNHHPSK